jgi:thiol-disulfide isomerase/thioredoxin
MKRLLLPLVLVAAAWPLVSFQPEELLNKPMKLLPNKTLDGKTVDADYYKGHVTIVSFMFIGCMPCMNEIGTLNRINKEYAAGGKVQVLCVARQMRSQMVDFNSSAQTMFSMLRKAMHVDSIAYPIQPGCADAKSSMVNEGNNVSLKSECTTLEDVYGITSFPMTYFVDKKGMVRKIDKGGPTQQNDENYYNELKKEVEALMAE